VAASKQEATSPPQPNCESVEYLRRFKIHKPPKKQQKKSVPISSTQFTLRKLLQNQTYAQVASNVSSGRP